MPRAFFPSAGAARRTTAPAPSPNSTQVPRSCQSRIRENVSAPITKAVRAWPVRKSASAVERIDEPCAHRLHVEGGAPGRAELGLHLGGSGGKGVVGSCRRQHDEVEISASHARRFQRLASRGCREIGGKLAAGGDMALPDASPLHDPLIGGRETL